MLPDSIDVTQRATTTALVSVESVRSHVGADPGDAAASAVIAEIIAAASTYIDSVLGYALARQEYRAWWQPYPRDRYVPTFTLPAYPDVQVLSVVQAGEILSPADYQAFSRFVALNHAPLANAVYSIPFTAGYDPQGAVVQAPADLRQAAMSIASAWWNRRHRNPDVDSETLAGVATVGYDPAPPPIPREAQDILNEYIPVSFG